MRLLLILSTALALAFLGAATLAQAQAPVAFSIRPTEANPERPESFAYFSHLLAPGQTLADEALIRNDSPAPATLLLYAADATTAINGGTAFAHRDADLTGAGSWLALTADQLQLPSGGEQRVSFVIHVPPDTPPGEYVAGLILEAPPTPPAETREGEATQFAVQVVQRVGVAVVIEVPGPRTVELGITDIGLHSQDPEGSTFILGVENSGSVVAQGEGELVIWDARGEELATIPLTVDSVLPGTTTAIYVRHALILQDGRYLLAASLTASGALRDDRGATTQLSDVPLRVQDGQPKAAKAPATTPDATQGPLVTIAGTPDDPAPLLWYGLGAAALAVAGLATVGIRRRRARR